MKTDRNKAKKSLGAAIRKKRQELGYSQEAFAHQCGVHRTYLGAVERGERNISLMNIVRISTALNMKPSQLLGLAQL